jgi:hypothetical protein
MNGLRRYLELQAKSKTGLSSRVVICAAIAAFAALVATSFILFALFIWLAQHYTPLTAALILVALFLAIAIIALICCVVAHNQTVERARQELALRSNMPWLDARYLGIGMQVGRAIGWRKLLPLAAVGILAAGLAREWVGHRQASADDDLTEG